MEEHYWSYPESKSTVKKGNDNKAYMMIRWETRFMQFRFKHTHEINNKKNLRNYNISVIINMFKQSSEFLCK